MTREEAWEKYRGEMLVLIAEAWACRNNPPSELGRLMDLHSIRCRRMVHNIVDECNGVAVVGNGKQVK